MLKCRLYCNNFISGDISAMNEVDKAVLAGKSVVVRVLPTEEDGTILTLLKTMTKRIEEGQGMIEVFVFAPDDQSSTVNPFREEARKKEVCFNLRVLMNQNISAD